MIVKFDNKPVPEMRDLPRIVAETEIDKPVSVEVVRRGKTKRLKIVTGRLQEAAVEAKPARKAEPRQSGSAEYSFFGLTLQNINPKSRRDYELGDDASGALVTAVEGASLAYEAGLREGDLISEIDQTPVGSAKTAFEALKKAQADGRNSVLVFVRSQGRVRFIALPLSGN